MAPDNRVYLGTCQIPWTSGVIKHKGVVWFDERTGNYLYHENAKGERWISPVYESELRKYVP